MAKPSAWKRRLAVFAAGVLVVAGLATAWFYYERHQVASNSLLDKTAQPEKSIAVLPFESIGANKDDAYFADGMQDEIHNHLAKIAQLKVISRTSVMQYRAGAKRDLRKIANALGVAHRSYQSGGSLRLDRPARSSIESTRYIRKNPTRRLLRPVKEIAVVGSITEGSSLR